MNAHACQYAIARFLPYAETGEFANVGVVLACPAIGYLDGRLLLTKKTGRITSFFEQLDKRVYRDALGYLEQELGRTRQLVNNRSAPVLVQHTFAGLTRPREALLRFSETRAVLADEPAVMLDKLFARFVERDFVNKTYHDRILEQGVRDVLTRANLREHFKAGQIGNDDLHIQVPFVHIRDGQATHAIKTLDLARDEPNQVFEYGGHWVDRIKRLKRHHLLRGRMLFAVQEPNIADARVRKAADEIVDDLRAAGVDVAEVTDTATIADFARSVSIQ